MRICFLLGFFLISACSSQKPAESEFGKQLNALHASHQPRYIGCIEQEDHLMKNAVTEKMGKKKDDFHYSFPEQEQVALNYLKSFDYSKTDHQSEDDYFKFYLKNCSPENFNTFQDFHESKRMCSGVFEEYKFFQGLIFGISTYKWSTSSKKTGQDLLKDYLTKIASEKSSLTSVLLAISLVRIMSEHGLTSKQHSALIENAVHILENKRMEFVAEMKLSPPKNCAEEESRYQKELELAAESAEKLNDIIKKVM